MEGEVEMKERFVDQRALEYAMMMEARGRVWLEEQRQLTLGQYKSQADVWAPPKEKAPDVPTEGR
jgi:hypothetical protein